MTEKQEIVATVATEEQGPFKEFLDFIGSVTDPESVAELSTGQVVYIKTLDKKQIDSLAVLARDAAKKVGSFDFFQKEADDSVFNFRLTIPTSKTPRAIELSQFDIVLAKSDPINHTCVLNMTKNVYSKSLN